MPSFRMNRPTTRVFADLGEIEPGQVVEADENPHPAFFDELKDPPKPKKPTGEGA